VHNHNGAIFEGLHLVFSFEVHKSIINQTSTKNCYLSGGFVTKIEKMMTEDRSRDTGASEDAYQTYPDISFAMGSGFRVKQGIIYKRCPSLPILWQERYFVLKSDGILYYYISVSFLCLFLT
jgi:hypothetical protein